MKCRDLYTQLPMLERLAMKDKMPRAVAVKLGVKLVQMRAAWQILEASRTDLVKEIGTDKQGMVTDNERFSTEWNDVLDTEVDTIKVRPFTGERDVHPRLAGRGRGGVAHGVSDCLLLC
jgi:hypothetical protein